MIFIKLYLLLGMFFLIGCGGGGTSTKNESVIKPSSMYHGKLDKVLLNSSNIKKFIDADYYSNLLPLEVDASKSKGIVVDNHINSSTGLGYIDTTYIDYIHKNSVVSNGKVRSTVLSIKKLNNGYLVKVKVDMNIRYQFSDREIKYITIYRSSFDTGQNLLTSLDVETYRLEDSNTHENIEITQVGKKFQFYIASEGYAEVESISKNSDRFYGKDNTEFMIDFIGEESIYEGEKKLYTAKEGQGQVAIVLNGKEVKSLYFTPYKILEKEFPKIADTHLAIFSLDSWNSSYSLLNQDSNTTKVTIEWFVNGIKVTSKNDFELLASTYGENDTLTVRVTADNGETVIIKEESLNTRNYDSYWTNSVKDEYSFDIDYRTNELSFDINLLNHDFFKNIDVEKSKFSWKAKYIAIEDGTEKNSTPHVTFREYSRRTELFLKIFHNKKVDVVKFNIRLYHGDEGYNIKPTILATATDINVTNEGKNGYIRSLIHYDVDNNGLEDMIYTAVEYTSPKKYTLNIIYQDEKMKFDNHESYTIAERLPSIFTLTWIGDFNGDGTKDIAVPFLRGEIFKNEMYEEHLHIISLERGAYRELKEINTSNIWVYDTSDMNGDGKDDLLTFNRENNKSVIYTNIDDLSEKIIVSDDANSSINKFTKVADLNGDGLNDIITVFSTKKVVDENAVAYNDMLVVGYYLQLANHQYVYKEKYYAFNHTTSISKRFDLNYKLTIDEHVLIFTEEDSEGEKFLYSFDFNSNNNKLRLLSKVAINKIYSSNDKFTYIDINHDGKKDLLVNFLDVFYQRENYKFSSNYSYDARSDLKIDSDISSFSYNSFIADLDHDGDVEVVDMMKIDKFYLIDFK